jgi:fatty acid desaturase
MRVRAGYTRPESPRIRFMSVTEHEPTADAIDRDELRVLMVRRDGPGLVRISVQLALLALAAGATVRLAAAGHPSWVVAVVVAGGTLSTLFPPLHEAGHRTAFRTPLLNEIVVWVGAVAMLQAPSFFREFHWEHHRHTQNRARDPEIASGPDLLDDWPRNPIVYLLLVSGQALLIGKLMFTVSCAVLPTAALWQRLYPFIRPERRRRIAWESRLVLVVLGAGVWLGITHVPGFWALLVAWPIAHLVLGFYLMPEHTGLPHEGSQLHRTRTVVSNAFVRWFMWNMPYHAVHHAHPGVPFHCVPAANRRIEPALEHVSRGYFAFHLEAIRRAFGRP